MKQPIIIRTQLPTLNKYINAERGNRFAAAKMKKTYTQAVEYELLAVKVKRTGRLELTFNWFVKDKKTDPDNICFSVKFLMDALVNQKIIEGDGWKFIGGFIHNFEIDKENPRVEIVFRQLCYVND